MNMDSAIRDESVKIIGVKYLQTVWRLREEEERGLESLTSIAITPYIFNPLFLFLSLYIPV